MMQATPLNTYGLPFLGKHAIVTGAGRGIGQEIALALASHGADLCIVDQSATACEDTCAKIRALGRVACAIGGDTSDAAIIGQIQYLEGGQHFGPIDFLVNNAGISPKNPDGRKRMIWETDPVEWKRVVDVNLNGYFNTLRAILPGMIARKQGAIVNISSLAGSRYTPIAGSPYAVSKGAVEALTRQAAGEVAPHGIRVNGVAPGRIESAMSAVAGADFNEDIRKSTPLGRLGQPADIAQAVVFLLSPQASFITGQTLVVSGGRGL